ncbi:MAG: VOC family protein [Bacteroidota bacterium]|nr:glyoxalase [Ignavibacteria bacterium]MCU7498903.1 glyoxalase [Ignavibacteria bacterium]MCU7514573.1 glyoxalase [Ignavibacteria bacterium]MCU7521348.1 glyoxalase [Ignavibacteria bacterium]MCU7524206.1 glyoxalase [Ignavibacteria bacterium]
MKNIGHITILVRNYDEAIQFYTDIMGFQLISDNDFGNGFRWVTVAPQKQSDTAIVFVLADTEEKRSKIGVQASDHVFMTFITDNCMRDYERMKAKGVNFQGFPTESPWGTEVVFEDLYGNKFDLVEPKV